MRTSPAPASRLRCGPGPGTTEVATTATRSSRRRALGAVGGAAAALAAAPGLVAAQQPPPSGPAAPPDDPIPSTLAADASPEFRAVAGVLVAAMREAGIPGAALGVLMGDREEHATFGVESVASRRPVGPETLFQLGSLTKTYTATAVWRLVDEGALAPEAPVRAYLPGLRLHDEATAARVSVGNLLDHTAGWYGDEGFDTWSGEDALARYVAERLPVLPQQFPCGQFMSYNNAGFSLLGRLLEVATGVPYHEAMERLVLRPLGLGSTLLDRAAVLRRPFADGHAALPVNGRRTVAVQSPLWLPRSADPAGGLWGTTRDVLRYARLHLGAPAPSERAGLLRPATLRRMQEPAVPIPGLEVSMARNWFVQEAGGVRAINHGGDTNGQHALLFLIPERRFAFALLLNMQPAGLTDQTALTEALSSYPGLGPLAGRLGPILPFLAPADAPTVRLTPEQLATYAGRYADPGATSTVRVTAQGLELSSEPTREPRAYASDLEGPPAPPQPLAFLAPDRAVLGRGRVSFVRTAAGDVGWLASGLRLTPKVDAG